MEALGYIFLFYVGFYFYRLAEIHKKNKWLFGFLGIVIFIIGYFSYILFCRFSYSEELNLANLSTIGIKAFLVGLISSVLIFKILSLIWNRKEKINQKDIDKIGE
mgnify:CR=1 FL=1